MNLLIDTHILLWWLGFPEKLPERIHEAMEDPENTVFVSSAVIWEISIKKAIGKLTAPDNLMAMLDENDFIPLSITVPHVLKLDDLPPIHQDPFDRIQLAQCLSDHLIFVTTDRLIRQYPAQFL